MLIVNKKLTGHEIIMLIIVILFLFQTPLQYCIPPFQYYDEFICMLCGVYFIIDICQHQMKLYATEFICILLSIGLVIIGISGNYWNNIQIGLGPIVMDIGNNLKFILIFFSVLSYTKKIYHREYLIHLIARVVKVCVVIASICAILNFFIDIGMSYDIRFGIKSFTFIFGHAVTFDYMCYMYLMILTVDLMSKREENKKSKRKYLYIVLNIFIWCCTLRTRAFVLVIVYMNLSRFILNRKKINIKYIIGAIIIATFCIGVALPQIENYFLNTTAPRAILLKYGLITMKEYFPIGSGFATYGSFAASQYYSPLYIKYGFYNGYGIGFHDRRFLADTYWPAIMGELGFVGLVLMIIILCLIFRSILLRTTRSESRLACSFGFISILFASVVDASFANYLSISMFFIISLLCDKKYGNVETKEKDFIL